MGMGADRTERHKVLVMVPTYNERDNVRPLAERVLAAEPSCDLLFVDDNSPDGTGQVLDEISAASPRVAVMHRSAKEGIGVAHLAGIDYAYGNSYGILVTMDGDLTHVPEHIPLLLRTLEGHDMVAGSRFHPDGDLEDWTRWRKLLAHGGHLMTRLLLGLPHDATGAFRAYDLSTIPREAFHLARSRGYSFFFESMALLATNGASIADIPVVLPARAYGHSKMRLSDGVMSAWMLARTAARLRLRRASCVVEPNGALA